MALKRLVQLREQGLLPAKGNCNVPQSRALSGDFFTDAEISNICKKQCNVKEDGICLLDEINTRLRSLKQAKYEPRMLKPDMGLERPRY